MSNTEHTQKVSTILEKREVGRPKGSITQTTKRKIFAHKRLVERVFKMTDKLLNAQAVVALGSHKMLRPFIKDGVPSVETIRDEKEMQRLIDTGVYGKDYLIVVGAMPDWRAIESLYNRAFGKAKETLELEGEVKFSLKDLAQRRLQNAEHADIIEVPRLK